MKGKFDFAGLFVLDLANNHQGSTAHGLKVIRESAAAVAENQVRAGIKFQFRDLDTFVHPAHKEQTDNKHIPRFLSTRLSRDDYGQLLEEVRRQSLVAICTPFDERSVDLIVEMDIDVIKIASCSAADWPLIEKIAEAGKPVIFSTGGLALKQMDDLVSYFDHRRVDYAFMHCVAVYPTPTEQLELAQISLLKKRYPNRVIGFSTHEDPDDTDPVQLAAAKGAQMFERHVGVETDEITLNAYSSTPAQLDAWFKSFHKAMAACGVDGSRYEPTGEEFDSLASLRRGVYAKRPLKPQETLRREDVYFAMPLEEGQLPSGSWRDGIVVSDGVERDGVVMTENAEIPMNYETQEIYTAIHDIKAMLNEVSIAVPSEFEMEISHHYGMKNFRQVGAVLIDCVNRSYCKKIIVVLPGQRHPSHYHKVKEETFQCLSGTLELEVDGRRKTLYPGDTLLVQPGVWHEFWSSDGSVFEEISTTHIANDSYYEDKSINRMGRSDRKTVVENWGRHQIGGASLMPSHDS